VSRVARMLEISGLSIAFPTAQGVTLAVRDVSMAVTAGRTLGLVGESGSGKSTTLRAVLGLVPEPGEVIGGSIAWCGADLLAADTRQTRRVRGTEIGMIFQDPAASLHPLYSVGAQLAETLRCRMGRGRRESWSESVELLDRVGIAEPHRRAHDYPHQFSGGMRQRVMIALAIATQPSLLLADEPTAALDVTVQDQILGLLVELQEELRMAIIFVSHDLGVIAEMSDDIAVMSQGEVVEAGPRDQVISHPRHPYTCELLSAVRALGSYR
jgi:peptide/nickel transport system ATP-binding protein